MEVLKQELVELLSRNMRSLRKARGIRGRVSALMPLPSLCGRYCWKVRCVILAAICVTMTASVMFRLSAKPY